MHTPGSFMIGRLFSIVKTRLHVRSHQPRAAHFIASSCAAVAVMMTGSSGNSGTANLGDLIFSNAPSGFVQAPPGAPGTGPLNAQQFVALAGGQVSPAIASARFAAYINRWNDPMTGRSLVVLVGSFPGAPNATAFVAGAKASARQDLDGEYQTFATPIPDSVGVLQQVNGLDGMFIAFAKGRFCAAVYLYGRVGYPPPSRSVD